MGRDKWGAGQMGVRITEMPEKLNAVGVIVKIKNVRNIS
jgi:hypothetical protein